MYMYMCTCICICIYAYMHISIYVCIHLYIYGFHTILASLPKPLGSRAFSGGDARLAAAAVLGADRKLRGTGPDGEAAILAPRV